MKENTDIAGKTVLIKSLKKIKKYKRKSQWNFNDMNYLAGTIVSLSQTNKSVDGWTILPWMVEATVECPKEYHNKDWRDAFLEENPLLGNKVKYSEASCIKIMRIANCTEPRVLCAYVSTFVHGGFWFNDLGLYFVTKGIDSDPEATYEHAKEFISNFYR